MAPITSSCSDRLMLAVQFAGASSLSDMFVPRFSKHLCQARKGAGVRYRGRELFREVKREPVALSEGGGRLPMQVATAAGISPSMWRTWRSIVRGDRPRFRPASPTGLSPLPLLANQASEITRLKGKPRRTWEYGNQLIAL